MDTDNANIESYTAAAQLRTAISELFCAYPSANIVLSPGILVGLRILFAHLSVKHVALTTEEYYDPVHFPNMSVEAFALDTFYDHILQLKPDAVIASVVTWQGRILPVAKLFKQLRLEFGNKAPVWIADYSHAGAAGFPNITSLSADIVCGDPAKWIIPPWDDSKLAFFWLRTGPILEDCKQAFRPFFLSIDDRSDQLLARWVGSENIQTILSFLTRQSLNRSMLRQRHEDNMMLASTLAKDLGICAPVESSILWSEDGFDIDALPSWLKRRGLLWKPANQGMRILCRSDLKAHGMTS